MEEGYLFLSYKNELVLNSEELLMLALVTDGLDMTRGDDVHLALSMVLLRTLLDL